MFPKIEGHTFNPDILNSESIIIDIGGNNGGFASSMLSRFNCYVECYEPDIQAFGYMSQAIHHPKLNLINKAVASSAGRKIFYSASPMNGGNSLLPNSREWGRYPDFSTYEVDVESMDTILNRFSKIDLLKMDCEGSEIDILLNTKKEALKKIVQMTVEFHDFCFKEMTTDKTDACIKRLKDMDFEAVYKEDHSDPDRDYYFYRELK
jgi:FkbM family methyltransferase